MQNFRCKFVTLTAVERKESREQPLLAEGLSNIGEIMVLLGAQVPRYRAVSTSNAEHNERATSNATAPRFSGLLRR